MINCIDCMNYKTKKIKEGDALADTIPIQRKLEKEGATRIYYCRARKTGKRNYHSTLAPNEPIKSCELFDNADE